MSRRTAALLFLIATILAGVVLAPAVRAVEPTEGPMATWKNKRVDLPIFDTHYVPVRDVLLVAVRSDHASFGNELVEVDPETGQIGRHVFVGSQPSRIAASDDGLFAYVGLAGAMRIITVSLVTFTVTHTTYLDDLANENVYVDDIAVAPGTNNIVAFTLKQPNSGPSSRGAWAMRDGIVLPNHTPTYDFEAPQVVEFVASGHLYASYASTLYDLALDADGISIAGEVEAVGGGDIKAVGDLLVGSNGTLFDPTNPTVALRQYGSGGYWGAPKPDSDMVVFHSQSELRLYRLSTGELLGTKLFMEVWGGNRVETTGTGFASVSGEGRLGLFGPSVVPGTVAMPGPVPSRVYGFSEKIVALHARDLAFDPLRQLLYASIPAGSADHPNEVVALHPVTGAVVRTVHIGDDPSDLAVSDDLTTMYVALRGKPEIVRIDLTTFLPLQRFDVGTVSIHGHDDVVYADDIDVQPGNPGTIAVTLWQLGISPRNQGLALFQLGVRTDAIVATHDSYQHVEFGSPTLLFWGDASRFTQVLVTPTELTPGASRSRFIPYGGVDFELSQGLAWTSRGYVIDPYTLRSEAELTTIGAVAVVPQLGRAYQLINFSLNEYDTSTYKRLGTRTVNANGLASILVSTGAGLAALAAEGILLLQPQTCDGRVPTMHSTPGRFFEGTAGDDVVMGSAGHDYIYGAGGNDVICGVGGNDTLIGGDGDDRLLGGAGNDQLLNGDGADLLSGGAGLDAVFLDVSSTAPHRVSLDGLANDGRAGENDNVDTTNEMVVGSAGNDTLIGNDAVQVLQGHNGNDRLVGLGGNDVLDGNIGNDVIYGGRGDDLMTGGDGWDYCSRGGGRDRSDCETTVA